MLKTSKVSEAQNGENGPLTVAREPQSEPSEIAKRAEADLCALDGAPSESVHLWRAQRAARIQRAIDEAAPAIRAKALREATIRLEAVSIRHARNAYDGAPYRYRASYSDAVDDLRRIAAEAEKVTP